PVRRGVEQIAQPLAVVLDGVHNAAEQLLLLGRRGAGEAFAVTVLRAVVLDMLVDIHHLVCKAIAEVHRYQRLPGQPERYDQAADGKGETGNDGQIRAGRHGERQSFNVVERSLLDWSHMTRRPYGRWRADWVRSYLLIIIKT